MDNIPFIVALNEKEEKDGQLGLFGNLVCDGEIGLKQIPVDALKNNLTTVSSAMLDILGDIRQVGKFKLKEVTLEVEVNASGGVSLIGTANLGGKGAITLTFSE
jgi:hypothetical protein